MNSVKATKRHIITTWIFGATEIVSVLLGLTGSMSLYVWGKIVFAAVSVVVLFIAMDSCRTTKIETDPDIRAKYHKKNVICVWINIAIALIGRLI